MGALIADRDWSNSPLGPIETWPESLVSTLRMILPTEAQIVVFWGPEYLAFYNDAYAPTIGLKHPAALGSPAAEYWSELWSDLEPLLREVRATGKSLFAKDRAFYIERHGFGEEVYFDISYSAISNAEAKIDGVLCIVSETTERVRAERRSAAERDRLAEMFQQAPGFMALLHGPTHVFDLTNKAYQTLIGERSVLGRTVAEALPEVRSQGMIELLDRVFQTGEPFAANAMAVKLFDPNTSGLVNRYLDFVYQPIRDLHGAVSGIFIEGTDVSDRVTAIEAQRQSEERLRLATQAAGIGTWDFDPVTKSLLWDAQCKALFGLPPEAEVSYEKSFVAGLHPEDRERAKAAVENALNASFNNGYDIEYRTIGLTDGIERWCAARGRAMFVNDQAVRFVGTITDITELKSAQAAIEHSQSALRDESNALETLNVTSQVIAAELDLDCLVQGVVDAGVQLSAARYGAFFYKVSDDDGERYMLSALSGASREDFADPIGAAVFSPTFEGQTVVRSEDITKDNRFDRTSPHFGTPFSNIPIRSYLAVSVISRTGKIIGWLFFGHDAAGVFTERSQRIVTGLAAQAAIGIDNARLFRASERLNQTLEIEVHSRTQERDRIWQMSRDLLGVADAKGLWRSVNPAWASMLGWPAEEIVGRTNEWLLHPDDVAASRAEMARLRSGLTAHGFENRLRTRDGTYRTLSWTAVPAGGEIYAIARDVTSERDAALALKETEELLRQAQKMETIGQLSGGIAHDFNNLLQIVAGNLETLQRNLPQDLPRLKRAAENAMTGAKRAATLTQRLLAFSRRQPLAPKAINPNKLVAGMSELLHRTLGETIAIKTVLSPQSWQLEADPNQLESAILNLAINARDAMPDGGELTIETTNGIIDADYVARHPNVKPGEYVVICVLDTGTGMEKETLARAFEPFFTTKEPGKGTGLGLSMVYGFVNQSGGHVHVRSQIGHGTKVMIYLPRIIGQETDETPNFNAQPVPQGKRDETILVCEDDSEVRAYSTESLRDLGYDVLEAADGPSALKILKGYEGRIHLLFTDVVLPGGMTGANLAEQARGVRPDMRILFTTGYARDAIVHQGRLDAGVDLITKPFTYTDLATRIRESLDK